jgi:hypothetical protein
MTRAHVLRWLRRHSRSRALGFSYNSRLDIRLATVDLTQVANEFHDEPNES